MNLFKKVKKPKKETEETTVETNQQVTSAQVVYKENDLSENLDDGVVDSASDTKDVDGEPPLHDKPEQENNCEDLPLVDEETQSKIREIEESLKEKKKESENEKVKNDPPIEEEPVNKGWANFEDIQNGTSKTPNMEDDEFLKFKLKLLEENGLTDETVVGVCVTDNEIVKGTNFLIRGNAISGKEYNDCLFTLTNFYQTKIKNATFKNCTFTNALFKKMELENVIFDNCVFRTTHFMANFEDVYCRDVVFKECTLTGLRMQNTFGNSIDMSTCKFGNVNIVCSDIHAFALPKNQQYRYGVILDRPMKGFKKCIPLTPSQYMDLISGLTSIDTILNKDGINHEIFPREANFDLSNGDYLCVVELEIPIGAYVSTVDNIRFRTNIARITNILPIGRYYITSAISEYDKSTIYNVGETKTVSCFDTCPTNEFTNGIYFNKYAPKNDNI